MSVTYEISNKKSNVSTMYLVEHLSQSKYIIRKWGKITVPSVHMLDESKDIRDDVKTLDDKVDKGFLGFGDICC